MKMKCFLNDTVSENIGQQIICPRTFHPLGCNNSYVHFYEKYLRTILLPELTTQLHAQSLQRLQFGFGTAQKLEQAYLLGVTTEKLIV